MAFSAPWALVGLVALPILVWLHRRSRRPVVVTVPSVLFLGDADAVPEAPQRRRIDPSLLLALAAAALLTLGAAGPSLRRTAPLVVRVVYDHRPSLEMAPGPLGPPGRPWHDIEDRLAPSATLEERHVRGDPAAALAAAREGAADVRIVITDRRIVPEPIDVHVACYGHPDASNVGIVAARVEPRAGGWRLFANVWNDGSQAARVALSTSPGEARPLEIPAHDARSVVLDGAGGVPSTISLAVEPGGDLREDDRVRLVRDPLRVAFAPVEAGGYPEAYRRAVLDGLRVVMGASGVVEVPMANGAEELPRPPDLLVGEPSANERAVPRALEVLALGRVPEGAPGVRVDPRSVTGDRARAPLLGFDLDATGCDLVFPPRAGGGAPDRLVEDVPNGRRFAADPLAGNPAPVDHPIWPLFLDALVSRVHGRGADGGWRVEGVLDPELTRIGRDLVPFDPRWVEGAPRRTETRSLRDEALGFAAACLALLWVGGAIARRRAVP